ncbi:Glucokinase [Methylorubrum populi BJ001]|jgi:glucokinase|uniref:Glucokinase n=1 Tax=Methylorubrum populi (strain ATCC BAA-705 / NCIMB 13946 / BJ001) TaxID=441620 RepID=B1ZL05_METPB|nr:glucokinase [Methylorubrum populi]ACB83004.1 Glucokinase [Methylorubrum populi BJ001]OAH30909.1 glucokinase [Methylorubrum populi]PZP71003.1 MAG: glucokinase [Methylorubrum populi]
MFEFPVLIGDIGGTNARFGLIETKGAPPRLLSREATHGHPHPSAAIRASLAQAGGPAPRSAILAIAGRVDAPAVQLTNADWLVDATAIGRDFGLDRVALVNDYVPVAAGAAGIAPDELTPIGPEIGEARGPRLVLGPGTGFGAAALIPYEDRLAIVSTEAGHTDLGPTDAEEAELWPAVERVEGRVTVETLLSGPGLARLCAAIRTVRAGGDGSLCDPAEITSSGLSGADPHAHAALALFGKLLGRVCGDLALTFLAAGGVYIGGGIAPRIVSILREGAFREAFERKAPFAEQMRSIPTSVITVKDPAFSGLAALASESGRFVYHGQAWTPGS